jgi:FkbM family methyltransferase
MIKHLIYLVFDLIFYTFGVFEKKLFNVIEKKKKKIIIFDIGCFRGSFFKKFYNSKKIKNQKILFFLFDINPNVKRYLKDYINKKNIFYEYLAVGKKNQKIDYNFNKFFESSGSSTSNVYKNDKLCVFSRKLFLKLFLQKTPDFEKIKIPSIKLDTYIKKKKIKHIDILKIDVEGSELDIINGMKSSLLKKKFTAIQIEITEKKSIFNLKENKIIKIMKKYNYYLEDKKNIFSVSILSNLKCTENLFLLK